MRVNLYEQEYLSIKQIAEEWAKEPGKLSAQKIEQEIWRAYWLGHFVDENKQSTFMIPYEDREYISEGDITVNIIHQAQEEGFNKDDIKYFAIIYKEENGEIEVINFWVRHLYSSLTFEPLERFYTKIINKDGEIDEVASKEHNNKFVSKIKNIIIENQHMTKAILNIEDEFVDSLIWEYHIINLRHKMVAKYFPLERPFLFDRLYSNGLLEFTPKSLNKSFRKNESEALDNEDYKMLSEQNLMFSDEFFKRKNSFENDLTIKKLMEPYLNPLIMPEDFVGVCKKLGVKIPNFLDTANLNIEKANSEVVKKKRKGRPTGTSIKYKPIEEQVIILFPRFSNFTDYHAAQEFEKYFQEQGYKNIPDSQTIMRYIKKIRKTQIQVKEAKTNFGVISQ